MYFGMLKEHVENYKQGTHHHHHDSYDNCTVFSNALKIQGSQKGCQLKVPTLIGLKNDKTFISFFIFDES